MSFTPDYDGGKPKLWYESMQAAQMEAITEVMYETIVKGCGASVPGHTLRDAFMRALKLLDEDALPIPTFPFPLTYGYTIALSHEHEDDDHSDDHYRVGGIWRFPVIGTPLRIKDIEAMKPTY
jgi:hypothetical protein